MTDTTPNEEAPANDLLDGVKAIAKFTGFSERRTFYMLEKSYLPAGKVGSRWLGSKRLMREALARIAAGEAA